MNRLRQWAASALFLCAAAAPQAAPFTPASDHEVVQQLPRRVGVAERAQRAQLARDPQQLSLALGTARSAIERARRDGDPRELGLAQAVLAPWWGRAEAPASVRLLRAIVRQSQHGFAAALVDLNALAADSPAVPLEIQAQAGLTRASVLQVTGQWAAAAQACDALAAPRFVALGRPLATAARGCSAELRSLRGGAGRDAAPAAAAAELDALLRTAPRDAWLSLLRAELAERMGDDVAALTHYRAATAAGADVYARAAFADWLLQRGRSNEVLTLLGAGAASAGLKLDARDDEQADALLLRRAIALTQLRHAQAPAAAALLQARFAAARQRGESFHAREEARLALDVFAQAQEALALAQANWAQQKEPADALLLARAAAAVGGARGSEAARQLAREAPWADVRLAAAIAGGQP